MLNLRKTKEQKAITLIALIITIVVLLILAAVAISSIINEGVLSYAENGATKYNQAVKNEQDTLQGYVDYLNKHSGNLESDSTDGEGTSSGEGDEAGSAGSGENTGDTNEDTISKDESFIGYYADVDADGVIDGIIYADLAFSKSGEWSDSDGVYSYETKTNLNEYVVRDLGAEEEQGLFEGATPKVIAPMENNVEENNRFYVMALSDFRTGGYLSFYWYNNAYGNMSDFVTSGDFGTGKSNTEAMIEKWNSEAYGTKDNRDMWGVIQNQVSKGWFVPSRGEWSAFADAFSVTSGNYFTIRS